jgi:hypothetical protein
VTNPELEHRFKFHPATAVTGPLHANVRNTLLDVAAVLSDTIPPGREQALFVTKLEEAMMWANAAIARGWAAQS